MADRSAELVDEISQLVSQYRREVPGPHRAWPESLRSRVIELHELGFNFSEISRKTGLPYYTILKWRDEFTPRAFRMLRVAEKKKVASVAVTDPAAKVGSVAEASTTGAVVVLPSGARIEGLGLEELKAVIPLLTVVGR